MPAFLLKQVACAASPAVVCADLDAVPVRAVTEDLAEETVFGELAVELWLSATKLIEEPLPGQATSQGFAKLRGYNA